MRPALFGFRTSLRQDGFLIGLLVLGRKENFDHQDGRADYDRAVSDVEVGPDVRANKKFEEVDYVAGEDAVPQIPKRAPEDEGQGKGSAVESLRVSPQKRRNYDKSQQRKEDKKYDAQFGGRFREQPKSRAAVGDVGELEQAWNDSDALVERNCLGNNPFAQPVESQHDSCYEQNILS